MVVDGKGKQAAAGKKAKVKAPAKTEAAAKTPEGKAKEEKSAKKSRKVVVKKAKEVLALRRKVLAKARLPVFRGRFGKRDTRKKANPKWDKWRFPRGLDVNHELSEGFNPRAGHGTPAKIRHVHPSGYREFMARKITDIENMPKGHALRVASRIGKRKKAMLVEKAIGKGIVVLNP